MAIQSAKQIEQIKQAQSAAGLAVRNMPANEGTDNPLAFVIQTNQPFPEASLRALLLPHLEDVNFEIESLRETASEPLFFILTFPYVSFDDLTGSPFSLAYYLDVLPEIKSVDVDLETGFHPWQKFQEDRPGLTTKNASGCFSDASTDPSETDNGWALRQTMVDVAWKRFGVSGRGVKLAQIDSGLAKHDEFDGLVIDDSLGRNLYDTKKGAVDPLRSRRFDQPGHGTAVASVIISQGGLNSVDSTTPGKVSGVAQNIDFLPIRAIRSVIRIRQSKVAKAIHIAIDESAHIISMSLGGLPSRALKSALKRAEAENVIVMAAAGNCVPFVAFPAAYKRCMAVSGTTYHKTKWRGAATGKQVDFSAPAEFVSHANRETINDPKPYADIGRGQGTSFAVALSAGIAALWLEHFGRNALIASLSENETLLDRFRHCVKLTAQRGPDWPRSGMGAGIIDAFELLNLNPFTPQSARPETNLLQPFSFAEFWGISSPPVEMDRYGAEIANLALVTHQQYFGTMPISKQPPISDPLLEFLEAHPTVLEGLSHLKSTQPQ